MEYQQRLRKRRRGMLADEGESHVGVRLWRDAARHGGRAIGRATGVIGTGYRADWLVLDGGHPSMAGATQGTALDHLVFAGASAAIRHVMVAGRWVIQDRQHSAEAPLQSFFRDSMVRLASQSIVS